MGEPAAGTTATGRSSRRRTVVVAVVVVVLVLVAGLVVLLGRHSSTDAPSDRPAAPSSSAGAGPTGTSSTGPTPGAVGVGDPLFPGLGNGGYQVEHYDLALRYPTADPSRPPTGAVTVRAVASHALSRFDLDFAGDSVGAVRVDDAPADVRRDGAELVITPAAPVARGAAFTVTVDFVARPPTDRPGAEETGLLGSPDGTVWMGQPANAHQIFPSNDHPVDKATFSFRIDVPAGTTAVANGELVDRTTSGGRTVWRYEQRQPMATELAQVACGTFTVTDRGVHAGVTVRDVTPTRLTAALRPALAAEVAHLDWMRQRVGDYPFASFGSLVADGSFGFGGLETQTLILYPRSVIAGPTAGYREQVMVHELAHQWFGDSVSPRTWSDVWLNEGHATWYQHLFAAEHPDGVAGPRTPPAEVDVRLADTMRSIYRHAPQDRQTFGPPAAPPDGSLRRLFNPNVYDGGALVLYALRETIGTAAFETLEREWVTTWRGRSAGTADFVALASRISGKDLTGFADAWLYGRAALPAMPGHPDWTAASGRSADASPERPTAT